MSEIRLTAHEVSALTGYTQPGRQLEELKRQGFYRARLDRFGQVVLERAHYAAVCAGSANDGHPKVRPPKIKDGGPLSAESKAKAAKTRSERRNRFLAENPEHEASVKSKRDALIRFHANKRRCSKLQRTPAWCDHDATRAIYQQAARLTAESGIQHHVDHIIPLQGALVSGLHVPQNLQIITGSENSRKRNKFEVQ